MLMDMQEMVLAKVDSRVAAYYEHRLLSVVPAKGTDTDSSQASLMALGEELQAGLAQAIEAIKKISGHELLHNNPALQGSIMRRNPYIDPLHITQVELMRRLREQADGEEPLLEQGLMVSIAGIAAGLRNTG